MGDFDLFFVGPERAPRYTLKLPPAGDVTAFDLDILDDEGARISRLTVEPRHDVVLKHAEELAAARAP